MTSSSTFNHWDNYCANSSVHGVRYLGMRYLTLKEKAFWIAATFFALFSVVSVSYLLSVKFRQSILSTVVESTNYHVSEISFPAVTLCNNLRVDFEKFDKAVEKFLPGATELVKRNFFNFLSGLEMLDFGSFDEMEAMNDTKGLENLPLAEVAKFMSHSCETLFIRCWWRNKYLDCCDIFTVQKTEYGICHSFNSVSSAASSFVNRSVAFPWRTSSFNEWSGLRVEMKVKQSKYVNGSRDLGLLYIVHDPFEWPNIAKFLPADSTSSIRILATTFYVTEDVMGLPIEVRQCIYTGKDNSTKSSDFELRGLPYLQPNCIAKCRLVHMMIFCNCTLEIFYNLEDYPPCDIKGLLCMRDFNEYFNYEVPPKNNEFFNSDEDGMLCHCLPECSRVQYKSEVEPYLAMAKTQNDTAIIDFHFGTPEMVRYRTDLTFGWLDLMVGFGGVAGLFMGVSILSVVEMVYFFLVGILRKTAIEATPTTDMNSKNSVETKGGDNNLKRRTPRKCDMAAFPGIFKAKKDFTRNIPWAVCVKGKYPDLSKEFGPFHRKEKENSNILQKF